MKPLLCAASVVRNFLNVEVGSWPARAIDSGRPMQFQDRRPVKFKFRDKSAKGLETWLENAERNSPLKIGDVLYVREGFCVSNFKEAIPFVQNKENSNCISSPLLREAMANGFAPAIKYKADDDPNFKYSPSLHMPKWASRIHLEVMRVRVERACEISEEDAKAEGCKAIEFCAKSFKQFNQTPVDLFKTLWTDLYGPDAWEKWVWVTELKRIK